MCFNELISKTNYHSIFRSKTGKLHSTVSAYVSSPRVCKEHCYTKKAASVGQNGRLSASCNFFCFWLIKSWDHWISIYGSVLKWSFYTPAKRHNPIKPLLTWCDLDIPLCLQFYEFQRSLNIFVLIQYSEFWVKWTQWNVNPMQAPPLPSPVI